MPSYQVRAHNWATESENKIHDDAVARRYGFGGGLVPGVALFAYLVRPVVDAFGPTWLEGGTMSARFNSPIYEGELVTARATPADGELALDLSNEAGVVSATGAATVDHPQAAATAGFDYVPMPDPHERRPADESSLAPGTHLGSIAVHFRADRAAEYLDQIGDDHPLWREGVAHPGWLLLFANSALSGTVRLGPWIHVSSAITLHRAVRDGELVTTRGKVAERFERKGHRFVELKLLLAADDEPAWEVTHTAIYHVREAIPTAPPERP